MSSMDCSRSWAINALLACCLVLCSVRLTQGQEFSEVVQRTPTIVWSPDSYIETGSEGQKARVSYEVRLAETSKE